MSITLVQSTKVSFNGSSSTTKAFTSNVVAGNLLIVGHALFDPAAPSGDTISTPTDSQGNTYHPIYAHDLIYNSAASNTEHNQLFFAIAGSSGACTVTVGQGHSTGCFATVLLAEFSGIDANFPYTGFDNAVFNTATTTPSTASVITENVLAIGFCANGAGGTATYTEGSGYSNVVKETDGNTNQTCAMEYKTHSGIGSVVADYTTDSARAGISLALFLAAESDAAGYTPPTLTDVGVSDGAQAVIGFPDIRPPAIYDTTANKTILPYLAAGGTLAVVSYDHSGGGWGTPVTGLGTAPANDGHQSPDILIDSAGVYHIFWGCHVSPLMHTKANSAHSIAAWTAQTDVTTSATYPNVWINGDGTVIIFFRAGDHTADWAYKTSSDNAATWSAGTTVLDSTAANVFYLGTAQSGDVIHFVLTWEDESNSFGTSASYPLFVQRYGLYYLTWDTHANTWTANDGTTLTLPITKSNLDTHCVIRAEAHPLFDQEPEVYIGLDGYAAILSVRGNGNTHTVSFMKNSGSGWTSPVTICATGVDHTNDCGTLINTATNNWSAFIIRKGTTALKGDIDTATNPVDIGGALDQYDSTDNGATWTRKGTVTSRSPINFVHRVKFGISPVELLVADWVDPATANAHIFSFSPVSAAGPETFGFFRRRIG